MGRRTSDPFAKKPIETLLKEMSGGERLHRVLGPVALTALGVGATIGAGIFVLTGQAAKNFAGPSLVLSFVLAGFACLLAGLCYSELASMVPVAGSAYTYAYATLGELVAWIIGWDLVLEYAIGSSAVAVGWSEYLSALFQNQFGLTISPQWINSPWKFVTETHSFEWNKVVVKLLNGSPGEIGKYVCLPLLGSTVPLFEVQAYANLPAFLIVTALTVVLVIGIKESAIFNATMVGLNLTVILLVIGLGATYVEPKNWTPFLHQKHGWSGIPLGAAAIFFAYIGFDSISTHSEEAKNPGRDLAIGILGSLLICSVLYISVAGVLTGMVSYTEINNDAPIAAAFQSHRASWATGVITASILAGMTSSLLVGTLSQPRILMAMARDGMLPTGFFAAVHPKFLTPWKSTILVGLVVGVVSALVPLSFLADLVSVGTLFAFLVVCAAVWILRFRSPEIPRPFRVPALPFVAGLGILVNGGLMFSLGPDNWIRLIVWLAIGLLIYFGYSRYHTKLESADS